MTKRQSKNRKRIIRLVELWPESFNREKNKTWQWEALIDYIESLESVYDKIYTEGMFVLIAPSVLCAVVPVANIVVCLTYPGLAIYAFCKNIGKKRAFLWSLIILLSIVWLFCVYYISIDSAFQ